MSTDPKQIAQVGSIPAPIGGLNARDAWANMPETDAIILDNWFPQPTWVEPRGGSQTWMTCTGNVETVLPYNGIAGNKLYGAVNNSGTCSIFDFSAGGGGGVGAAVVGGAGNTVQQVSNARFDYAQFGTSVEVLIGVNGTDTPLIYNGSAWAAATISGMSGVPSVVGVYGARVWYGIANTFNVYYTAVNAYQGAVTLYPLGQLFLMGGYLQSIASISVDNTGGGINDYIAFISSVGEVILFQGTDPSQVSTWALSAHFRMGRPLASGRRCWTKIGMDLLYIGVDGAVMLSQEMLTDRSANKQNVSDKIRQLFIADTQNFGTIFGWQVLLYPFANRIVVNVPTVVDSISHQYVMNTLSGAWCSYGLYNNALNAIHWEMQGDNLYFGTANAMMQAETTETDNNLGIVVDAQQAFSYFGNKSQIKHWKMARLILTANAGLNVTALLNTDFQTTMAPPVPTVSSNSNALWNVSYWSTPTYWSAGTILYKAWQGVGGIGYTAGLRVRLKLLNATAQWQSTEFVYEYGGVLG